VAEPEHNTPPYARVVRRLLTPRLSALHLLGVVATTTAVLLGLWQYDAWQAGRATEARDLASARPVPLDSVLGPDAPFPAADVGRPVSFTGRWLPESTLLVADREHGDRTGRWLVTPVAVCAGREGCEAAPAILVVRGWLPREEPAPPPPTGTVGLTGWLQPGEGRGLPDPDPRDRQLPELRIASAIQHVDRDLYGGYVIARDGDRGQPQRSSTTGRLEAVTPASLPEPASSTSLRNLLYALQWWVFAGFAAFLWWRWVRDELDAERDAGDAGIDRDHDAVDAGIASGP
jgi:surfeit locus 1 family protein